MEVINGKQYWWDIDPEGAKIWCRQYWNEELQRQERDYWSTDKKAWCSLLAQPVAARPGKIRAHGLVRDRYGRPKIDDIQGIHPAIWALLRADEQQEIKARGGYPSHDLRP